MPIPLNIVLFSRTKTPDDKCEKFVEFTFAFCSITTHELKVNTIKHIFSQQILYIFFKIQFVLLNNFFYTLDKTNGPQK